MVDQVGSALLLAVLCTLGALVDAELFQVKVRKAMSNSHYHQFYKNYTW